jgi:hypothetical protein
LSGWLHDVDVLEGGKVAQHKGDALEEIVEGGRLRKAGVLRCPIVVPERTRRCRRRGGFAKWVHWV